MRLAGGITSAADECLIGCEIAVRDRERSVETEVVAAAVGGTAHFFNKLIDSTPTLVLGFLSSLLGTGLVIIAVLKLGGFDEPVVRVVNAYASAIELSLARLNDGSKQLVESVSNLETVIKRLEQIESRTAQQHDTLLDHERRINRLEIRGQKP